jgi:hypothetical protein
MTELLPSVTLADADGNGIVKRIRRPALSCVECRMRKVKCDREKPCGGCVKIGSSRCTYRPSRAAARGNCERSPSSTSGSRSSSIRLSLHKPTAIVSQRNTTNVLSGQIRSHLKPSIAKNLRAFTDSCTPVGAISSASGSLTDNVVFRTPVINDTTLPGTGLIKDVVTDLPGSFQKSKFFGQSHWMNALEPVSAVL